jgi:hypothetical protein
MEVDAIRANVHRTDSLRLARAEGRYARPHREAVVANARRPPEPDFRDRARGRVVGEAEIRAPVAAVASSPLPRVYVVMGDRAEERIVTTGQTVGDRSKSPAAEGGEAVATSNVVSR